MLEQIQSLVDAVWPKNDAQTLLKLALATTTLHRGQVCVFAMLSGSGIEDFIMM